MPHPNASAAPREHAEDIDEAMQQGAPQQATRNINHDVHLGHAAQRPWAALEDHLAQSGGGKGGGMRWPSFEALQAALPEGDSNQIEQDESGDWVRYVPYTIDHERDLDTGELYAIKEDRVRYVALSKQDAKARSAGGLPCDYFDGFTWWRNGLKPEKDLFVAQQQAERRNLRRERVQEGYSGAIAASGRPLRRERLDEPRPVRGPLDEESPDYELAQPPDSPPAEPPVAPANPVEPPASPPAPPAARPRRAEGN